MFINKFFSRTPYDLFAEFVDHVRAVVSIGYKRPKTNEHILQLAEEPQTQGMEMKSAGGELIAMYIISTYSRLAGKIELEKPFTIILRPAATIFTTSLRLQDGKIKERNFKFTGNQNYRSVFQGQVDFLVEHFLAQKGEPPENILSSTINLNVLLAIQYIASRIHDVSSTNRKTEYIFRNADSKSAVIGS